MVQAVAQGQTQVITLTRAAIHTQEEEQQGPMGQEEEEEPRQEEHPHQEEAIQAAMQAAPHLQGKHPRSSQEEQVIQAARHQPLQLYLIKEDILIHGLHWIDPGKLYRSSICPPITRIAAYWTCSRS